MEGYNVDTFVGYVPRLNTETPRLPICADGPEYSGDDLSLCGAEQWNWLSRLFDLM